MARLGLLAASRPAWGASFVIPVPNNPRAAPTVSARVLSSSSSPVLLCALTPPQAVYSLARRRALGLHPSADSAYWTAARCLAVGGPRTARSSQVRVSRLRHRFVPLFPFPGPSIVPLSGGSRPHDRAVSGEILRDSVCCSCSDSDGEGAIKLGALCWWKRRKEIAASLLVEGENRRV